MTPRLAGTWLLVVVSASPVAAAAPVDPGTGPDQRIAYYRARAGGTGSYVAWARLGQAYLDRGRMTGREQDRVRAERCLARSLAYQPNLEALRGMAVLRLDQHRFGEALELAAEAAAAAPEDVATRAALFDAHFALGDLEQAARALAGSSDGRQPFEVLARRALLARRHGDRVASLALFGEACEAETATVAARAWCEAQRGELHLLSCEPDGAERAYTRALELRPGDRLAREHRAELRIVQRRFDEALALYRGLIAERADPDLRTALAELYAVAERPREAARERGRALRELRRRVARGSPAELRPLALLLLDDPATAEEGLALAERDWRNRQDLLAADTLAWALFRNARGREAVEVLRPFHHAMDLDPALLLRAATIVEHQGHRQLAREVADRLPCAAVLGPVERESAATLAARIDSARP